MRFVLILPFLIISFCGYAESVHEYHLNNGLKILVKEDHRAPVIFSSVWYKVGSSYECDGVTGISHVLEHMMFRGTKRFPAGALEKLVSEAGGLQNAFTANDQTVYHQELSADKLSLVLQLEADRMRNLVLSEKDFEKEIQVVMEERRMRTDDDPTQITYERFMAAAFLNNPYHHQTIGWMNDLKSMNVADLRRWYTNWYQPNNALLIVVGDVQPENVYSLSKKYFDKIPSKPIATLKPREEVPSLGIKRVDVEVPAQLPLLLMGYSVPTLATTTVDWHPYALDILSTLLGNSKSSRFQEHLVHQQQIVSSAQVSYEPFQLYSGQFVLYGIPTQNHSLNEVENAFTNEIEQLKTEGITEAELSRVKTQTIANKIYNKDSLVNQAMDLGIPESIGLSWRIGEDYPERIKSVTAEQVRQMARTFLISKNLTVATLHPTGNSKTTVIDHAIQSAGIH